MQQLLGRYFLWDIEMAKFTVRVELHGATAKDYAVLHENMAFLGFTNTIMDETGQTYNMLPAEYNYHADSDIQAVLDAAHGAAQIAAKNSKCAVFVSKAEERAWVGLESNK